MATYSTKIVATVEALDYGLFSVVDWERKTNDSMTEDYTVKVYWSVGNSGEQFIESFTDKYNGDWNNFVDTTINYSQILPYVTGATSYTIKFTAKSYKKGTTTLRHTATASQTVQIPASVIPTCTGLSLSHIQSALSSYWVRNESRAQITVYGSGIYGSSISRYRIQIVSPSGITGTYEPLLNEVTMPAFTEAGTYTIRAYVIDSRGRMSSARSTSVNVYDYFRPVISGLTVRRVDENDVESPEGSIAKIGITGRIAQILVSGIEKNTVKNYRIRFKATDDDEWSGWSDAIESSSYEVNEVYEQENLIGGKIYEFEVCLQDCFVTDTSINAKASTGFIPISFLEGGKGVNLFRPASEEGFWIDDVKYSMSVSEQSALQISFGANPVDSIIDWIYPIGSIIYNSNDNFNPNNVYAGTTWTRIVERFIFAAGNTYLNGAIGGEITHLLTSDEAAQKSVSTGNQSASHTHATGNSSYTHWPVHSGSQATDTVGTISGSGYKIAKVPDSKGWTSRSATGTQSASHTHSIAGSNAAKAHNNMPPFVAVYVWERRA